MNVAEALEAQARTRPDALAITGRGRPISFKALALAVERTAVVLQAQGIAPGDPVGVTFGFVPEHVVALLALARLGAVVVPLSRHDDAATRKAVVEQLKVVAIVGEKKKYAVDGCGFIRWDPDWVRRRVAARPAAPGGERPWALLLSSGTTGTPRAIVRSHAQAMRLARLQARLVGVRAGDRFLCMVCPSLAASQMRVLRHLLCGSAVVFQEGSIPDVIARFGVTHTFLTPTVLENWIAGWPGKPPKSLRHFATGGGPVTAAISEAFMERVTPNFFINYGTVETALSAIADPQTHRRHPRSIGRIVPWLEAQVVDERDQPLPAGQPGALRFRGDSIATSYFPPGTDALEEAKAFRGGWFYPGDIATIDAEGLVTIEGRSDDVANVGGAKVALAEVERVLAAHPGVIEAAAFRSAAAQGWDLVMVAVVLRPGVEEQVVMDYARERLGKRRAPSRLFPVEALPRNAMGKVLRRELESRLGAS